MQTIPSGITENSYDLYSKEDSPMFKKTALQPAAIIFVLAMQVASILGDVPTYRVQYLGAGWTGTGINAQGDVCGSMSPDGTSLVAGVSHDGQPFELLPLPPGMQTSRAHDINDAGVIVGSVCPNQYVISQPTAAVWRPTAEGYDIEVLGVLPGDLYSGAYAINNIGDIVGGSGFWGWNPTNGVLFTNDGPVALPEGMMGLDINDQRVVLTGPRLLDLDTGQITEIPLPPGNWQGFQGAALNEHNDFCGYILGYSGCSTFPMRFRQGIGWEYLGGCATTTSATAMNDNGDAVQYYYFTTSGVSFVNEGYFAIGSLIDLDQGAWSIQAGGANGINNSRQIIAAARQGLSGPIGAVLLTPVVTSIAGDLNGDGFVDAADQEIFVAVLLGVDTDASHVIASDLNSDGEVDGRDAQAFVDSIIQ